MRHAVNSSGRETAGDFGLHERLRRRRNRALRLNRAGFACLAAAALLWLSGLAGGWQLAGSLLAAATGLVWPVPDSRRWALARIGEQTGLAYETALSLENGERDDYGLRPLVRSRARAGIAGMELPAQQEWWLAALTVAAVLLLLPSLRLVPPWHAAAPPPPAAGGITTDAGHDDDQAEDEETADATPVQAAAEPEEALPARAATAEPGSQAPAAEAGTSRDGREAEAEVLDRFLDNLRERREPQAAGALPLSETPAATDTVPEDRSGDEAEGTAPGDGGDDGAAAGREDGAAPAGTAAGDGTDEAADPAAGDDTADSAAPAGATADEPPGGGPEPQAGPDGGDGDGAETPGFGDGAGDSAGGGPGPQGTAAPERLEAAAGREPELLEGQLGSGPVNLGGDVRLPGFSDVELPPGAAAGDYGRAVERSLSGGNVPLDYQEVIRDYFR